MEGKRCITIKCIMGGVGNGSRVLWEPAVYPVARDRATGKLTWLGYCRWGRGSPIIGRPSRLPTGLCWPLVYRFFRGVADGAEVTPLELKMLRTAWKAMVNNE